MLLRFSVVCQIHYIKHHSFYFWFYCCLSIFFEDYRWHKLPDSPLQRSSKNIYRGFNTWLMLARRNLFCNKKLIPRTDLYLSQIKGEIEICVRSNCLFCRNRVLRDSIVPGAAPKGTHCDVVPVLIHILYENINKPEQFTHSFLIDPTSVSEISLQVLYIQVCDTGC